MCTKLNHYYKFSSLIILVLLSLAKLSAQKQNANWYFGNKAAISFTNNSVSAINTSSLIGGEGTASISDSLGNFLFYTNGFIIYNRLNNIMVNGDSLKGNPSCTQSSLICPKPCSSNIYYVFTNDALENDNLNGLCYSEVNMNLGNGNGAVTSNKNVNLVSPTAEKLTGTLHSNAKDYWVVTHGKGNTNFYSFLVTSSGVNTAAVVSSVGNLADSAQIVGQMKISFNGQKLALGYLGGFAELYDFNPTTGIVSNPILIPDSGIYGVEFSKSGRFLYLSDNYKREIYQYDLNASNLLLSKTTIGSIAIPRTTAGLQLAPNGKIYGAIPIANNLSVINLPELLGTACSFTANGQSLSLNTSSQAGLPNFFLKYTSASKCNEFTNIHENPNELGRFTVFPNPARDLFYIEVDDIENINAVGITDMLGNRIKTIDHLQLNDKTLIKVDVSDLSPGTYFITLKMNGSIAGRQKLNIYQK